MRRRISATRLPPLEDTAMPASGGLSPEKRGAWISAGRAVELQRFGASAPGAIAPPVGGTLFFL